MNRNP